MEGKAIDKVTKLATDHVEWFLSTLKPLLISHFVHGFKHGAETTKSTVTIGGVYKPFTIEEGIGEEE